MHTILDQASGERWTAIHGDCVLAMSDLPDDSVGHVIYSPPFGDLFVYSSSLADMGNCADDAQFMAQYERCIAETHRVLMPGRLAAVHCTDLPTRKGRDGVIGLRPFSDQIVAAHMAAGFILHCRITVWRDPVVEMQRTKALGLLYKQLQKDSGMSRMGLADYILVFRKRGDNPQPIGHRPADFPVDRWQQWASPVWMDVRQGRVLNVRVARAAEDEKHVCPLQLDIIERAVTLWSNPGDVVLSPFMGIGSEGYEALRLGRRFVGCELKREYFDTARRNLAEMEATTLGGTLFAPSGAGTLVAPSGADQHPARGYGGAEAVA